MSELHVAAAVSGSCCCSCCLTNWRISVLCRSSRSPQCPYPQSSATWPALARPIQTCQTVYRCDVVTVTSDRGLSSISWLWRKQQLWEVPQAATAQWWAASAVGGNKLTTVMEGIFWKTEKCQSVQWIQLILYHLKPWWTPTVWHCK